MERGTEGVLMGSEMLLSLVASERVAGFDETDAVSVACKSLGKETMKVVPSPSFDSTRICPR